MMLEILSNELDNQKADLEDLLNIAKSKHNDEMRLINSYK